MKVNQQVQAIFNAAYNEAKLRGHEYLTPEHILYASLSFEQVRSILEACDADIEHIKVGMEAYFEQKIPAVKDQEPIQTAGFQSVIERVVRIDDVIARVHTVTRSVLADGARRSEFRFRGSLAGNDLSVDDDS